MADVKYIITADAKGAVTQIKNVEGSIKGMKTQAKESISPVKGMFTNIAKGLLPTVAVGLAVRNLAQFMGDAVEKAKEQELAEKGLADALASTGREVPINAAHFKNYAKEMQGATRYGDEQILSAQALMIQLTDLDQKGIDRATKGSVGLATVFKTDLKAATNLVAKALAGNYGALSRYGISVTDLNTEEEKRASLLDQLGTLYERAKGEVDTYEGTIAQLKNTYGDFKEKIGDVIVKSEELRGAIGSIQELMNNFIESGTMDAWANKFDLILKNVPIFRGLKESIFMLNLEMEGQIQKEKQATETGEKWYEFLRDTDEELKIFGVDLYEAGREFAGLNDEVNDGKEEFSALVPEIKKANEEFKKIEEIIDETVLPAYREWSGMAYNTQEDIKTHVFNANDEIAGDVETTIGEVNKYWEQLTTDIGRSFGGFVDSLLDETTTFEEGWKGFTDNLKATFRGVIAEMVSDWVKNFLTKLVTSSASGIADVGKTITGGLKSAAGAIAGASPAGLLGAAVGGAVGGIVSSVLGAGQEKKQTKFLQEIVDATVGIRDVLWGDYKEEFHTLQNINREIQRHCFDLNPKTDLTNRILGDIKKNFEDIPTGAGGLDMYSGASGGLARYHANERITITPNVNVHSPVQTTIIDKIDKIIIRQWVQGDLDHGHIRVPTEAVG